MWNLTRNPDCPECAQGKCVNCTLTLIHPDTDTDVSCGCRIRDHRRDEQ